MKDGTNVKGVIDNGSDSRINENYHWVKTSNGYYQVYKDDMKVLED